MSNTVSNIANLDFDDIKQELKDYLKNQDQFVDFDFEGAGITALIDLLAYNTHLNAMMSHIVINESFLETSQVRSNVVSHAQLLGYVPASRISSSIEVDITLTGIPETPAQIILREGLRFIGRINNREFSFRSSTSYPTLNNGNNTYTFNNVKLIEGQIRTDRYVVDNDIEDQQFIIQSDNPDITNMEVTVFDNPTATVGATYTSFTQNQITGPDAKAYFIKENKFGEYSVSFGDGRISRELRAGERVEIKYFETVGADANGITTFSLASALSSIHPTLTNISISKSKGFDFSLGGRSAEGVESVRKNAPIYFATQDRAVTANDYRALILNQFTQLSDCSVWGGQDASPPVYGKVFIAPALPTSERLPTTLKENIINFLRTKNIGSITPEVVDSEYNFIDLFVGIKYDTNRTDLSRANIEAIVRTFIKEYNENNLNSFNSVFRSSNFLAQIDALDEGIISSVVKTNLYKNFTPNPLKAEDYTIKFPTEIIIDASSIDNVRSTSFNIEGITARIGDEAVVGDPTTRRLFFFNPTSGAKIPGYGNVGSADVLNGIINIRGIKFDLTNQIRIEVTPNSFDIAPIFNQLLFIKEEDVTIEMSPDTVSSIGSAGLSRFQTFPRN